LNQKFDVSAAPSMWAAEESHSFIQAAQHPENEATPTDANHLDDPETRLSPEKRAKLEALKAAGAGTSCHQCKSRRNLDSVIFCINNTKTTGRKNKRLLCKKKYCAPCLKKFYGLELSGDQEENFLCPGCAGYCVCAACRRRQAKSGSSGSRKAAGMAVSSRAIQKRNHAAAATRVQPTLIEPSIIERNSEDKCVVDEDVHEDKRQQQFNGQHSEEHDEDVVDRVGAPMEPANQKLEFASVTLSAARFGLPSPHHAPTVDSNIVAFFFGIC
jgi:hypothetical protein